MQISVKYTVAVEFLFCFFVILMDSGSNYTSILSGITAKLWQRSSAIKTTITLYRGVDRRQTVLETFQVHYNVLPRLAAEVFLSFQMQCHFQKTAKGFSLTFCWISFKFFWWFSSILNFLFLIISKIQCSVTVTWRLPILTCSIFQKLMQPQQHPVCLLSCCRLPFFPGIRTQKKQWRKQLDSKCLCQKWILQLVLFWFVSHL